MRDKSVSYTTLISLGFICEGNVTKSLKTKSAIEINSERFPATSVLYLVSLKSLFFLSSGNNHRKGKAVLLQAFSGPEGSRKLRFPDFMTTAQDGGKVVSLKHRPYLPPGNTPGTHFC